MLLIEADGKALFRDFGIPVPAGVEVAGAIPAELQDGTLAIAVAGVHRAGAMPFDLPGGGPWMVKAQIPASGRAKAGGIVRCQSVAEANAAAGRMLGSRLKGHTVDACLVEPAASGEERYLAVMVDPVSYGLRVIYSMRGGIEIEQSGSAEGRLCPPHPGAVTEALAELIADEPPVWRDQIAAIGKALASLLLETELALAEINPLFVAESGCIAGDAKVVVDLNAVGRQPRIASLLAARPTIYVEANRKIAEEFDYVELDPDGEIGLVTTGAGLSMMLIDELTARGAKPLNFCDIRTSQMRGSPDRLIRVLEWITSHSSLKAVLVNVFAGITDLGEFAGLLAAAIQASPGLRVPVVARLVGRNAAAAQQILGKAQPAMLVTEDLEKALARIDAIVRTAS
jgi:succinyl-CoA synthetase beta subunit